MVAAIERRQAKLRDNEDFDIKKLLSWSAFAGTYDATGIFEPGTYNVLPMSQWPDPRLKRLVDRFKVTEKTFTTKDGGTTTIRTVEVAFMPRAASLDRVAALMGVPKRIKVELDEVRSIPVSVIDALVGDDEDAAVPISEQLSIEEVDAQTPNDNG